MTTATAGKPRRRYTREQRIGMRRKAQEMREQGHTLSEIATAINVAPNNASAYVIASDRPRLPGERVPRLVRQRAMEMLAAGRSAVSVAIQCNIHQTTANRWLREHQNSLAPTA